jgi:YegS/Rv2252/BmrU family lipid kinase
METLRAQGPEADRIVIGGGDGTISRALPILLELGKPLAVLPLGTANDFARTLGLPPDQLAAACVALNGRPHTIDVGLVNGRPFLNVASVGVATKVAKEQSRELKRRFRTFAYAIGLFRALRDSRPFLATMLIDDKPAWSGPVYQVSVGNGRFHGGGLTVAEHAAIDDGKLDLYLVHPGPFWQLVACITHLKFGFSEPALLHRAGARRVALQTSPPKAINADGELGTETPAEFAILPQALTVIVPQALPPDHAGLVGLEQRDP